MYLIRWCIIKPFLFRLGEQYQTTFQTATSELDFFLLVFSVVVIAAAGYLHNDMMDRDEDEINKPGKNIIGTLIDPKKARGLYYLMTTIGLALAYWLASKLGNFHLSVIQLVMAVSLWFYSVQFKSTFLAGNLVVAFLIGLVPVTVGVYEVPALYLMNAAQVYEIGGAFNFNFLSYWTLGFGAFAFLFTLAREITKDIEDIEGDDAMGAQTLPIILGVSKAKYSVVFVYLLIAIFMIYVQRLYLPDYFSLVYMIVLLLGVGGVTWQTLKANTKKEFHQAGMSSKLLSVAGMLYAVGVAIMLYKHWL